MTDMRACMQYNRVLPPLERGTPNYKNVQNMYLRDSTGLILFSEDRNGDVRWISWNSVFSQQISEIIAEKLCASSSWFVAKMPMKSFFHTNVSAQKPFLVVSWKKRSATGLLHEKKKSTGSLEWSGIIYWWCNCTTIEKRENVRKQVDTEQNCTMRFSMKSHP